MNKTAKLVKLGDIADIKQGQSPESKYYSEETGAPFLQGNRTFGHLYPTFDTYTSKVTKTAKQGEILMSVRAPVGDLNVAPSDLCIGRGLASLNSKVGTNYFIYYALKHCIANLQRQGAATTYSSVNKDIIKDFDVIVPKNDGSWDLVASILFNLDRKIEVNNKLNKQLECVVKLIYDYWFVQFDFPDKNGKPYKSSGGKMVWNDVLKREIPDGWDCGSISRIGNIISGSTPSKKDKEYYDHDGMPWITPNDLSENQGNKFISRGKIGVSEKGLKSASLRIVPGGTVLLTSRAPVGYLAISRSDVTTNQGFKSFVPQNGYTTEYVFYTLQTFIPTIVNNASGSTFKEISASMLEMVNIWLPPTDVVKKYTELVKPLFQKQDVIELENEKLTKLRDWLLPMLMNGQVKVSEDNKFTEYVDSKENNEN